ncbi:MAG: class I SAM-dependent methyltransferase [Bacteroidota bacterium]|nr:class I SAM-dependent methyltransferase [Bacteroidota bacterium]
MNAEKYINTNKAHWNERVLIHKESGFYELENFRKGKNKLHSLEREELGDIKGKSILHLQCHFGMDTLSLEMLGADVTGVDFSEEGIKTAVELRDELGMNAEFILSDIYSLPSKLDKKFDIVFTSYGVLTWLPDLVEWGKVVSHFLKSDGFFYIAEIHPTSMLFHNSTDLNKLEVNFPYFNKPEPLELEEEGTYAERDAKTINNKTYEWIYSLSNIFMALIDAGLKIEFFHEFAFTVWEQFPWMKKCEDGYYRMEKEIPLLFSLKAAKI